MPSDTIEISRLAKTSIDSYPPEERKQLLSEVIALIEDPANRVHFKKVPDAESLYVLDMASGLRAVFRTDETGRIVDLVDLYRPWVWTESGREAAAPGTSP